MRHAASHARRALRFTYRRCTSKRERARVNCVSDPLKKKRAGGLAGRMSRQVEKKKEENESCRCSLAFRRTYIAYMSELPKEPASLRDEWFFWRTLPLPLRANASTNSPPARARGEVTVE